MEDVDDVAVKKGVGEVEMRTSAGYVTAMQGVSDKEDGHKLW